MGILKVEEIVGTTGGKLICRSPGNSAFTGVSIDSRTIKEGEVFVALKGQRFDGHSFLRDAMTKGGGAIVSSLPEPLMGKTIVFVEDTLKALQDIARHERVKSRVIVIGVTGTNGKTTTKELIALILGTTRKVMKNPGNLNNHIGLPLSLVNLREGDEFAVVEMGASKKGDIKELCDIAFPDYGVVTNVGPSHLEGFGSLDGVRKTKLELFDAVKTIAVNADDHFLMKGIAGKAGTKRPKIITFGLSGDYDIHAKNIVSEDRRSRFDLCLGKAGCIRTTVNLNGRFNISNALAAASLGFELGIRPEDIREGIESFKGVPMRLEFRELSGLTVISDVYNANPASVEEALRELVRVKKTRAIAVLGDMLELGGYAEEAHRRLGKWMSVLPLDLFIAVGPMMSRAAEEFSAGGAPVRKRVIEAADASEAGEVLRDVCEEGDTILVKGSRSMEMEKVLEHSGRKKAASGVGNAL